MNCSVGIVIGSSIGRAVAEVLRVAAGGVAEWRKECRSQQSVVRSQKSGRLRIRLCLIRRTSSARYVIAVSRFIAACGDRKIKPRRAQRNAEGKVMDNARSSLIESPSDALD